MANPIEKADETAHLKIGALGEELVAKFLMKRGYTILERNYRRPWGELDLVAKKRARLHFVEVKSVSSETGEGVVSDETSSVSSKDRFRPEDNVHPRKMARLSRIIQTYLAGVSDETVWQFDLATVFINSSTKRAKINFIEDLILETGRKRHS